MSDIPSSWEILPLGDVIQIQKGKKPVDLGHQSNTRIIPYINIKAFEKTVISEYAPEQEATVCEPNDILLVWDGARSGLSGRGASGYVGSTLTRIRSDLANTDYLYYFIDSCYSILNTQTKGVGIPHINPVILNELKFPLPPKNEQKRIVDKLEELLSDLDNGVAEIKAAQTKLTQYLQSLLKSAVEGTLTQQWRENHKSKETGEQLLERILIERRNHWEQNKLEEFKEKGKTPPKDWQKKYPEPVKPDTSELPELPEGWVWASLSQIARIDRGRSKHRPRNAPHLYGGPYPFVQTGDIRNADTNITKSEQTYSDDGLAQSKLWPKGTMCITIAANIGETAILRIEACFPDSIVGVLPVLEEMPIEFIEFYFRTIKQKLDAEAPATAQKNINLAILSRVTIPLPSLDEQKVLVEEITNKLEDAHREDEAFSLALKQSNAQRKNILKSAFSGELVEQDSNDEPAIVLLNRIKEERSKQVKPKRAKKKMARAKKINVETVINWIHDNKKFSFDDLRTAFSGDYDELKDVLFAILGGEKPIIKQVFDRKTKSILFVRVQG